MITNILAYIDGRDSAENAAETAFQLATRHNAHVNGLHVRADVREFITNVPIYTGIESLTKFSDSFDRDAAQAEKHAIDIFMQVRDRHAAVDQQAAQPPVRPTANWTVIPGRADSVVSHRARVSDVCVIGRASYGRHNSRISVIEAALFDSGRPVLIAPPHPPASVGRDIVISWNRSAASARALNSALPLLDKADRIRLIHVETGAKTGPSVEEAAAYVAGHGFNPETVTLVPQSHGVASTLLWNVQNADLLVMGAYSHNRLRDIVLGGVTRYILENATIPVLMVH